MDTVWAKEHHLSKAAKGFTAKLAPWSDGPPKGVEPGGKEPEKGPWSWPIPGAAENAAANYLPGGAATTAATVPPQAGLVRRVTMEGGY